VLDRIRAMGTDLLIVSAGQVKVIAGRARQIGNVTTLLPSDADALAAECPDVRLAAPAITRKLPVKHDDLATTTTVLGMSGAWAPIRGATVASGRFFGDDEERAARRLAVLGPTVAANLFGGRDPVGETVRIGGVPFEVAGLLVARGTDTAGQDQDDVVVVPARTALRRIFNVDHVDNVYVQAVPGRSSQAAIQVRDVLRERHRLRPGRADDFTVQDQAVVLEAEQSSARAFTLLVGAVSAVALLIGGVGVLAVLLIAVRERGREIGLRRAIGATRRDVQTQFLVEAAVLGTAGAAAGLVAGTAAALLVAAIAGWPVRLSPWAMLVAVVVSIAVSVLSGVLPARRAARLDPVTALRGE